MACKSRVSGGQEAASAIPGNIGIVRSKVLVWDHDPMLARAHQQYSFPFSQATADQLEEDIPGAQFELNAVMLKPLFEIQDMWVSAKITTELPTIPLGFSSAFKYTKFDFVRCDEATDRMPPIAGGSGDPNSRYELDGGQPTLEDGSLGKADDTTGKSIFPHQTWLHVGSLLKRAIPLYPFEYDLNTSEVVKNKKICNEDAAGEQKFKCFTVAELQTAPKFRNREIIDNDRRAFWPEIVSKHTPEQPVHWTLEKFLPVWQGQDFFVTIAHPLADPGVDEEKPGDQFVDTDTEGYKYLIYDPKKKPTGWVDGISNEAFYVPPTKEGGSTSDEAKDEARKSARKRYWWKYKSYILIEIGVGDPIHNYFIELVKGRKPRFLHLGEEWDNKKRLQEGADISSDDFDMMRKCRVLSEYNHVTVDELFQKEDFRVSVRKHFDRLVISFQGYEGRPWVITRLDNDKKRYDFVKVIHPIIVPSGKLRIHGGNISCAIGFAPTRYTAATEIPFYDRQIDSYKLDNDDVFLTFAHIGEFVKYENASVRKKYFKDKRFGPRKVGYDIDAFDVVEINKNKSLPIPLHKLYKIKYDNKGKGWIQTSTSPSIPVGNGSSLQFKSRPDRYNGLDPDEGGVGHRAVIFNIRAPSKEFPLDITEDADSSYPYKEYVAKWHVGVRLKAGSVIMPEPKDDEDIIDNTAKRKLFEHYVTPVVASWTLCVLGGEKPFEDKVDPFDIAPLVISMNDSWSAEGFTTLNHEMQVRCYIPDSFLPTSGTTGEGQIEEWENIDFHAIGQRLLGLHNKSFYVTVAYWWDNGIGEQDCPGNLVVRRGSPENDHETLIQMTGIAYGGQLEKSVNKLYMNFTIKDYTSILDKQFIFNSPFFDGVNDTYAIYELVKMAGFDDSYDRQARIDRRPLGFIQKVLTNNEQILLGKPFRYNGEESRSRPRSLPGSYSDVANPSVRFQNGETFLSAILKIATMTAKVFYCDRWGVLRYENSPAIEAAFQNGEDHDFRPKFQFVTTPWHDGARGAGKGTLSEYRLVFNSEQHASHLVYEVVQYSRSVEDAINQIVLFTASNDIMLEDGTTTGGFIVEGYTFFEQIWDPESEGFFGFRKPFYQSNGLFGGIDGVRNGLKHYAKMKYPPSQVGFQTYGVPGLKALDIITLDDNLFYITEIVHELDPSTNRWWMNVTAEWLKPFYGDLGFVKHEGESDSGVDNPVNGGESNGNGEGA